VPASSSAAQAPAALLEGLAGVTLPHVALAVQRYGEEGEGGEGGEGRGGGPAHEQRGPLLITHRGVSGPAALRLSAFAASDLAACGYRGALRLRPVAGLTNAEATKALRAHAAAHGAARVHSGASGGGGGGGSGGGGGGGGRKRGSSSATHPSFNGSIPRRAWDALASRAAAPPIPDGTRWADCSKAQVRGLAALLSAGVALPFRGKDANKEEFVTAGGVALHEVSSMRTMESAFAPGLYFAGELLDVDGVTGGFNFQACWTTGHHAGEAAAQRLLAARS